jgi:hypothetical protein
MNNGFLLDVSVKLFYTDDGTKSEYFLYIYSEYPKAWINLHHKWNEWNIESKVA